MKYQYEVYNSILFRYEYNSSKGQILRGKKWIYDNYTLEVWWAGDGTTITEQEALEFALKKGVTKEEFYSEMPNSYN
jgi:hypothetical protein